MLKQTIVSYPERGPYGDGRYRGNTSGYLIKDLIETFGSSRVFDPMEGSGTTRDVCRHLGVEYEGRDLRDGWNILDYKSRRQIEALPKFDFIFFHPPYWNMITYRDDPMDFSQGTYPRYVARMQDALGWFPSILVPGGRIALLLADLRRPNSTRTYFLTDDVTTPKIFGLIKEFRIIKIQHNTASDGDTGLVGDVRMVHEYVTIYQKG